MTYKIQFKSPENAVEWAVRTSYMKNLASAKVSMPSQVVTDESNDSAQTQETLSEEPSAETSSSLNVQKWVRAKV